MATAGSEFTSSSDDVTSINIGTRKSALAMKQTHIVIDSLQKQNPTMSFNIHGLVPLGDKDKQTALYEFGGKGLWTTELEEKLAAKEVDIIVHSLKDMPTTLPDGMILAAVMEREDPRDVVCFKSSLLEKHQWKTLSDLPSGSVIGTSSVRRIAQLSRRYPVLKFADMRGNIDTRLKKLDAEESPFSAIILAAAGLLRMDYGGRIAEYLDSKNGGMLHAVGQGAIGVEARAGDEGVLGRLKEIQHEPTMLACVAERSLMRTLEGGCSVPIGVETEWLGDGQLSIKATVVNREGTEGVDAEMADVVENAEAADELGKKLAQVLVDRGAQRILDVINQARPGPVTASTATMATS